MARAKICRKRRRKQRPEPVQYHWYQLPPEIRNMILHEICEVRNRKTTGKVQRLAGYATVCLEWQRFFEPVNFRRVTLDYDGLETFSEMVKESQRTHRLNYIKHLWFRIKLPEYDYSVCFDAENRVTINRLVTYSKDSFRCCH